ncbi:uncharacterized protein LOC132592167 [Zootoca vivipara]|uniref:uncharacterized protein LOC132592167 n=1 Tax=Zootoca vivipara TaxID=8524 RepID=UPI00293BE8F6|nr:uncharacterized protein LOC132592167 [Zootoca vivipara]
MRAPGCCLVPLLLALALAEGDGKAGKEGDNPGNFMEDEQWLSSISQYSGKIKHWNRFRDVSPDGEPMHDLFYFIFYLVAYKFLRPSSIQGNPGVGKGGNPGVHVQRSDWQPATIAAAAAVEDVGAGMAWRRRWRVEAAPLAAPTRVQVARREPPRAIASCSSSCTRSNRCKGLGGSQWLVHLEQESWVGRWGICTRFFAQRLSSKKAGLPGRAEVAL